jgi:drug/metabolite transporter (DMT)-like permease
MDMARDLVPGHGCFGIDPDCGSLVLSMGERRTAYLFLLAMAVCFGGTWPAGKLAVEDVTPFTVAATRFTLATLLLAAWAARRGGLVRPARRDLPLVLALGATAVAGYNALFLYGLELAPASDGAIIVPGLAPVFSMLIAWLVLGERIGGRGLTGLMLAFAGVAAVIQPSGGVDRDRVLGAVLFVAGAACWGVYSVLGKSATARFGAVTATLYATATGALMLLPFSIAESGWSKLSGGDGAAWASILYLAVFGTVLAFVFFYEGVSRIGPSRATAFALLVPIFGVLGSVLVLGVSIGAGTFVGGIAILAGLWLVQKPSPAREPTPKGRLVAD